MVQLQSILFPDHNVCQVEELYFHRYNQTQEKDRIDFDGYFNLFYIEKRKKYTRIEDLSLQLTLYGYKELILVHDGTDVETLMLSSNEKKDYRVEFPYGKVNSGVFWFALVKDSSINNPYVAGAYITEKSWNPVHIGVDICTFRRETYVQRNLLQLKEQILDNQAVEVSEHVQIFVIDNGKTLEDYEPVRNIVEKSQGRIKIYPNMNAGGAGGFTRGMIEILNQKEQKGFTHVLVMDDDAVVEPDTLVRIYGFLTTVKDEWKDVSIGGAMMREEHPYILFCAGEWWENGRVQNIDKNIDVRLRDNAVCNYLIKAENEYKRYSGWWCCCYSLNTVRKDNLPIPLFIHHDDIEYCLRNCKQGMVFLNGVGVWHRSLEVNFHGSNIYYDIRNALIDIALHQEARNMIVAAKFLLRFLTSAGICMKYQDVNLIFRGFKDFMKGPEWLYSQDPEKLNNEIREEALRLYEIADLKAKISEKEYESVLKQIQDYKKDLETTKFIDFSGEHIQPNLIQCITYNGWLLPADQRGIKVISSIDSPFNAYRKKKIVLYEVGSEKVFLIEKDYRKFIKIMLIYFKIIPVFVLKYREVVQSYRNNLKCITDYKSWSHYLKL